MAIQIFNTVLLSAEKTGNPPLLSTSLSAAGVNVIALGDTVQGIAFNELTPSGVLGTLVTATLSGTFRIDQVYSGSTMALILDNGANTTFVYNSAYAVVPLSATTTADEISTPDTRRKWLYGYI